MARFFISLVFLLCGFALPVQAQQYPEYDSIYVNDFAGLIEDTREARITQMLTDLKADHGVEFTVVTLSRMSDYGWDGALEPFATGLFNEWGVGDASRNDGVMLLVARYDRKLRIEVGAGYDRSYDGRMKRIIDDVIVPYFKTDDYPQGIEAGVMAVIKDLTGQWPSDTISNEPEAPVSYFAQPATGPAERENPSPWWISIFAIPVVGATGAIIIWRRWRRHRPRRCPVHETKMYRIDEFADDEHLDEGQRLEERLESVDYDVWRCDTCGHVTVEAYKAWFSSYCSCPSCHYRTFEGADTVLLSDTTSRSGLKRLYYPSQN